MTPQSPDQVLAPLKWRYATKIFDASKKIPADQWAALEESLVLTPSSFGLQPWEFVVVTDQGIREQLVEHSWNQRQVADASHLLVIALRTDIDEAWCDRFIARVEDVRGDVGAFGAYRDMMVGFITNLNADALKQWAKLQCYIALGQFMTTTALLGIDACPMEGFVPEKYDELLGFKEKHLSTAVLCPAGYRSTEDKYAELPKVRFPASQVVSHL